MLPNVHPDALNALVYADHGAPFEILGPHPVDDKRLSIRALRPDAATLTVITAAGRFPMTKIREEGLFEATLDGGPGLKYQLEAGFADGHTYTFHDPYAFGPTLTDFDRYLFGEGRLLYSYTMLGAHPTEIDGVKGVRFAVWAPNAKRVSVVGNFNHWDARFHPMRNNSGVWDLFIPGLAVGEIYKYDIFSHHNGYRGQKIDPYGFQFEVRPNTAAIVADISGYHWGDSAWMTARETKNLFSSPMAIYEVHLGSWRQTADGGFYTYRQLADELVKYVAEMGYTHIELLPVTEHPFDGSWGYQTTGYYAPTSRFGPPQDFKYFVDQCHQHGIGVILDWVPAHFPKDGHALSYFDGTHLYSHADPRQGEHPDWGTYIFNYGRNEVKNFLISSALFWLKEYHIDGLRVDAVSSMLYLDFSRKAGEWVPNQYGGNENLDAIAFIRESNEIIHRECPGAMVIAEESTAWPMVSKPIYLGGLGFTFKWNMGWMHDTLAYIAKDPIYRRFHHHTMTFSMLYAFSENFILSLSHDEVVHGKGSLVNKGAGDWWQKFATLRLLFGYQYTHPGKKLNFMGQEFAQWREWSEARSLDWFLLDWPMHANLQRWMKDLNHLYQREGALYEQDADWKGFRWIDANDADQSVFSYIRYGTDPANFLVVVSNFTPIVRHHYRVGVPEPGTYREILNSDSVYYGGSNVGNMGEIHTEEVASHTFPVSLNLTLPPLGIVILKRA